MTNTNKRRAENTLHSLRHLRDLGYRAESVERWIERTGRRKDLFGIIDILGIGRPGMIGVQVGSISNRSQHWSKIVTEGQAAATDWIIGGARLVIHSWEKPGGGQRWKLHQDEILPVHLGLDAQKLLNLWLEARGLEFCESL